MDKYTAVWISHSSLSDFLACPRAYYLKNVYRDSATKHKIKLMTPALALGSAVHEVLESLAVLPTEKRLLTSPVVRFESVWEKFSGKGGGFSDLNEEFLAKERGKAMLWRVLQNPGPISRPAVKMAQDLPYYWISEADNIILCGKIDWLEYLSETNSVHVIDFKTGKKDESESSLQLPIYYLLVSHCQSRPVTRASYWYLDRDEGLVEKTLPDPKVAHEQLLAAALKVKLARQLQRFNCPNAEAGCWSCKPYEAIIRGEAELVGEDEYKADVYILPPKNGQMIDESVIL